jgi:hypothetical protein
MSAYMWRIDDRVVHHLEADSESDARLRIATLVGDVLAERAVIIERASVSRPAAA